MSSNVSIALTGRVAIVQLGFTGHRLFYVRTLVEAADEACRMLLVTSQEALSSREMGLHLGAHIDSGRVEICSVGSAAATRRSIPGLARTLNAFRATRLVLLDGDRYVLGVAIGCRVRFRRRLTAAVLIMRTPLATGDLRNRCRAWVKMALLRLAKLVGGRPLELYFLTDSFGSVRVRPGYPRLLAIPDPPQPLPSADRESARARFGFDAEDFVVGVFGALNESKHPDLILSAAASRADAVRVLVAGPCDEWTAAQVGIARAAGARVTFKRGYLGAQELAACIGACDAVALTYDLDAPSGFLVSAYQAGIPVLAAGSRWIVRVVADRNLGVVCEMDEASIVHAIDVLASRRTRARDEVHDRPATLLTASFAYRLLGSSNICRT